MLRGQPRVDEPPAQGRVDERAVAALVGGLGLQLDVRRPGHRFDAAADEHVAVADRDRVGGRVDRLQTGAAQSVDGEAADLDREVREEQRHPGDIAVVLAGLVGATEDDVLDEGRVQAGPVDDGAQHDGGQIVRPDPGKGAAVTADRRPDGLDDPGFAEGTVRVAGHGAIVAATSGPGVRRQGGAPGRCRRQSRPPRPPPVAPRHRWRRGSASR